MQRQLEAILKPEVQRIFDQFSSCFNIRILFYSPDGGMPSVGLNSPDSHYCRLVQQRLYGEQKCLEMDQEKRDEAAAQRELVCYQCHAGLVEAIKPIYLGRNLLGFVAIGQFRSRHDVPGEVMSDWCPRWSREDLESAYAELPFVAQNRIDDILGLFSILVDYIVMQNLVLPRASSVPQEITEYMEAHVSENLTLEDAARMVSLSCSAVSHAFAEKLGVSFKRTQIEIKLRKAEQYMLRNSGAKIAEVAAAVGYLDPLYFSRIYRRYRGFPPSEFLRNQGMSSGRVTKR